MLNGRTKTKLLLCSSVSLCLAAGIAVPISAFAQQNEPQPNWTAPLNTLNDVQKTYAGVQGMVSEMHQYGLAPREKAAQALQQIRSDVLQVRESDKVPQDLLHTTLIAIDEAQTALSTDNAQTIAWSLQTVGVEVQDLRSKLTGQKPPAETASQERPTVTPGVGTRAPDQASTAAVPEQKQPRVAEAEHTTGVTPQTPQGPNSNVQKRVNDERGQSGPMQQAAPEQPMQQSAQAKQPAQPTPQQSAAQNAVANMKHDAIVGKYLYDKSGNDVAQIQDVKTTPDGKIQSVEIDVGGFLGIGSRRIAVPVNQLQLKGSHIESTSMTAEQIRNLPDIAQ